MIDITTHPYAWAVDGAPVGVWQTEIGTASVLMQDTLIIRRDGTGEIRSFSALFGEKVEKLVWKHLSPGAMRLIWVFDEDEEDETMGELNDDSNTFHYCADWVDTDTADKIPILRELKSDNFWVLYGPIHLSEKVEE